MDVKKILKMGSPSLREQSLEVSPDHFLSDEIQSLIEEMKNAMRVYGGVGIAAPQIGVNKRVILFGFDKNLRYPNESPVPLTVLINPVIEFVDNETISGWEGCLSVPGLRGLVRRNYRICYTGFDEFGQCVKKTVDGFHARIIQHECDHLNGILYPDKLVSCKDFGFEDSVLWQ